MIRRLVLLSLTAAALVVPAAATAKPAATTISVTAGKPTEFRFTLSKSTAKHGAVTFKVKNGGNLPHDFKIAGKKTPLIQPGKSTTLKITFKKAGKYPYQCTVPGHAA